MANELKKKLLHTLLELEQLDDLKTISRFDAELQRLRSRLSDDEFRIAVVGEFSSGKSTFINALLGQDILQHATTETTATLTRIVNVQPDDPRCKTGEVHLCDNSTVKLTNFSELRDYTTTTSEKYNVVNDVTEVELYMPVLPSDRKIILVDTPGLNGTADGHRDRTISLVQQAHSCIYLISRRGLADSDIQFLTYLSQYQRNFLFIQNFIDDFRKIEGEDLEEKLADQRKILEQKVFSKVDGCRYTICGISALKALVAQDTNIKRLYDTSTQDLSPENRSALYIQSNFDEFRTQMAKIFQADRLEELQYGDTARAICGWIQSLTEQIERRENQANEVYAASTDHRAMEKLAGLREKVVANKPRQTEYLKNFVSSRCAEIQREIREHLKDRLSNLNDRQVAAITSHKDLVSLEKYEESLPNEIEYKVTEIVQTCNGDCQLQFQSLYQVVLARIEEYSGIHTEEFDPKEWSHTIHVPKPASFQKEEDAIKRRELDLAQNKRDQERAEQEHSATANNMRQVQSEVSDLEWKRNYAESTKQKRLSQLGNRPAAKERQESYEVEVYRGGFGFLDALFGPKVVTRYRTVKDDSAGKAWDVKQAQIQNEFTIKQSELIKSLGAAQRRQQTLLAEQQRNESKIANLGQKIQDLEQRLAAEKATLEAKKKYAADEYLTQRKKALTYQMELYLLGDGGVFQQIEDSIRKNICAAENDLCGEAVRLFEDAVVQKLHWIDDAVQRRQPEIMRQAKHLEETHLQLQALEKEMRGWLA